MLDIKTIAIIKSSIPSLAKIGPDLTAHFYDRMFTHNPELKDIFNMSNQRNGDQREALFNAIVAYASNIDNLECLLPAVEKIAHKHTSFCIRPEQYSIVGEHLIATIDETLNPNQEVLNAWRDAYDALADIFIKRELELYRDNVQRHGGWEGTRDFYISRKRVQSTVITSFEFEPVDGEPIASYEPGQYIGIWIKPIDFPLQEIRQYSLTRSPDGKAYRIAVKREPGGKVSGWLHDVAKEGDVVQLVSPAGDFYLATTPETPVTLISAGVGQTPMLAMLHVLSDKKHPAQVNWIHAAENGKTHAFSDEVKDIGTNLLKFKSHIFLNVPDLGDTYDSIGMINLHRLKYLFSDPATRFYLCGPIAFMQIVAKQLVAIGVNNDHIHYECFGPHKII